MFLHLGKGVIVYKKDVIAILDAESILESEISREFLETYKRGKPIDKFINDEPRSFVIVDAVKNEIANKIKIYYSPISALTLQKRANFIR